MVGLPYTFPDVSPSRGAPQITGVHTPPTAVHSGHYKPLGLPDYQHTSMHRRIHTCIQHHARRVSRGVRGCVQLRGSHCAVYLQAAAPLSRRDFLLSRIVFLVITRLDPLRFPPPPSREPSLHEVVALVVPLGYLLRFRAHPRSVRVPGSRHAGLKTIEALLPRVSETSSERRSLCASQRLLRFP